MVVRGHYEMCSYIWNKGRNYYYVGSNKKIQLSSLVYSGPHFYYSMGGITIKTFNLLGSDFNFEVSSRSYSFRYWRKTDKVLLMLLDMVLEASLPAVKLNNPIR